MATSPRQLSSVAPVISNRIVLPSGDGIIFCVLACAVGDRGATLGLADLTELAAGDAGLGAAASGAGFGVSTSLIFRRPCRSPSHRLAVLRFAMHRYLEALRQQGLQHCGTCSLVAPSGILPMTSNLCPANDFNQQDPQPGKF